MQTQERMDHITIFRTDPAKTFHPTAAEDMHSDAFRLVLHVVGYRDDSVISCKTAEEFVSCDPSGRLQTDALLFRHRGNIHMFRQKSDAEFVTEI